jgi:23S rRNA (cytosine1962-C5)-methyltransferase
MEPARFVTRIVQPQPMQDLSELLNQAHQRRSSVRARLAEEDTDCWRLFHGTVEGRSGLTIDKYGSLVLAQTFHQPLSEEELELLVGQFGQGFVYNHRGDKRTRFQRHAPEPGALAPVLATEFGLKYSIVARHRGLDPHLFLDLRVGRRWLREHSDGCRVLNLFAYSCSLGQVAAASGAGEVWNVDFSESALKAGERNLDLNSLDSTAVQFVKQDVYPVVWQLSGTGVKGKRARRPHKKFEPRQFDLVLLDPPARARGPFHSVDLVNDYQSLFKPSLLCLAEGGRILATNNVASVSRADFESVLVRCAEKAGRPLQSIEWLTPDQDFPSFDGEYPLKVAIGTV